MKSFAFGALFLFVTLSFSRGFAEEPSPTPVTVENTIVIAKQAALWGYPLVRFERMKNWLTETPGFGHAPMNTFFHASHLMTPKDSFLPNPLPDVLYSSAMLDLRKEPMTLVLPPIKDRVFVLQLFDAFNEPITVISSRTHKASGGSFFIVGPGNTTEAPEGYEKISVPTNFAWLMGYLTAADDKEADEAQALFRNYLLRPYSVVTGESREIKPKMAVKSSVPKPDDLTHLGAKFYDALNAAIKDLQIAISEAPFAAHLASIGIGPGKGPLKPNKTTQAALEKAFKQALEEIDKQAESLPTKRGAWSYLLPSKASASDPLWRAAMAKGHFGEIHSAESIHPIARTDMSNAVLNGKDFFALRFPESSLPPKQGVWTISLYNAKDGSLVKNSEGRYFISSLNKKLGFNENGSLDIYFTSKPPVSQKENWLPIPAGDFYVMMNFYNPTDEVLDGGYAIPPLQKMPISFRPLDTK